MTITQQPKAETSQVVQPFTVVIDGDEAYRYAHIQDARKRANRLSEDNPQATVEIFDSEKNIRKLAFLPKDHPVKDEVTNEFGVSSMTLWVAGQKLQKFEITQEQYEQVCQSKITLDEAIDQIARGAVDKPKKVAAADGSKKRKTNKATNPKKEKQSPAGWSIVLMDKSGKNIKSVIIDNEPAKDHGGCSAMGSLASKVAAKNPGRIVKHINNRSGKEYIKKAKAPAKTSK